MTDQPDAAFSSDDEKNMSEIYALLSLPTVALPDANSITSTEKYDPTALLSSIQKWPEDKRFPCKLQLHIQMVGYS